MCLFYADGARNVSKSLEGLAKMMTIMRTAFEVAGLTVAEKKAGTMLVQTRHQTSRAQAFVMKAAGQRYRQTTH